MLPLSSFFASSRSLASSSRTVLSSSDSVLPRLHVRRSLRMAACTVFLSAVVLVPTLRQAQVSVTGFLPALAGSILIGNHAGTTFEMSAYFALGSVLGAVVGFLLLHLLGGVLGVLHQPVIVGAVLFVASFFINVLRAPLLLRRLAYVLLVLLVLEGYRLQELPELGHTTIVTAEAVIGAIIAALFGKYLWPARAKHCLRRVIILRSLPSLVLSYEHLLKLWLSAASLPQEGVDVDFASPRRTEVDAAEDEDEDEDKDDEEPHHPNMSAQDWLHTTSLQSISPHIVTEIARSSVSRLQVLLNVASWETSSCERGSSMPLERQVLRHLRSMDHALESLDSALHVGVSMPFHQRMIAPLTGNLFGLVAATQRVAIELARKLDLPSTRFVERTTANGTAPLFAALRTSASQYRGAEPVGDSSVDALMAQLEALNTQYNKMRRETLYNPKEPKPVASNDLLTSMYFYTHLFRFVEDLAAIGRLATSPPVDSEPPTPCGSLVNIVRNLSCSSPFVTWNTFRRSRFLASMKLALVILLSSMLELSPTFREWVTHESVRSALSSNGFWAPITALLVLEDNIGASCQRSIARILGTGLGCACSLPMLLFFGANAPVLTVLMFVSLFAFGMLQTWTRYSYAGVTAALTMVLLVLGVHGDVVEPEVAREYVLSRALQVLFGVLVSLFVAHVIFPLRAGERLRFEFASSLFRLQLLFGQIYSGYVQRFIQATPSPELVQQFERSEADLELRLTQHATASDQARLENLPCIGRAFPHREYARVLDCGRRLFHSVVSMRKLATFLHGNEYSGRDAVFYPAIVAPLQRPMNVLGREAVLLVRSMIVSLYTKTTLQHLGNLERANQELEQAFGSVVGAWLESRRHQAWEDPELMMTLSEALTTSSLFFSIRDFSTWLNALRTSIEELMRAIVLPSIGEYRALQQEMAQLEWSQT